MVKCEFITYFNSSPKKVVTRLDSEETETQKTNLILKKNEMRASPCEIRSIKLKLQPLSLLLFPVLKFSLSVILYFAF
jgi:hypothetical protein